MNYHITSDKFHKSGFVTKSKHSEIPKAAIVISYLKNRDRSNGFKTCLGEGHIRTIVINNFIMRGLNLRLHACLDEKLELIADNMDLFKKWVSKELGDNTILLSRKEFEKLKS